MNTKTYTVYDLPDLYFKHMDPTDVTTYQIKALEHDKWGVIWGTKTLAEAVLCLKEDMVSYLNNGNWLQVSAPNTTNLFPIY